MDDIKVMDDRATMFAWETAVPKLSELKRLLPRIAEEFGCTADELQVFDHKRFSNSHMSTSYRDLPYKTMGFTEGLPIIGFKRTHGIGSLGNGVTFYKCRLDNAIRYAVYQQEEGWQDVTYVILKKGSIYRWRRLCNEAIRRSNVVKDEPILAPGLLESVLANTIGFLQKSKEIEKFGVKIKRGVMLDGPPGNGKTHTCRYIQKMCAQLGYRWGVITSADIDQAYEDKELDRLFTAYTVTFFDDIDISYMDRSKGKGQIACSLLTAMDGMAQEKHLVRIFTTNEDIEKLDPAFTRPGRIDQCFTLLNPEDDLRRKLIDTVWPKDITDFIDVDELTERSEGLSFAELEAIRTFLVTNKLLGTGEWNLDKAFQDFEQRREVKRRGGFGFQADPKKTKSKRS